MLSRGSEQTSSPLRREIGKVKHPQQQENEKKTPIILSEFKFLCQMTLTGRNCKSSHARLLSNHREQCRPCQKAKYGQGASFCAGRGRKS